MRSVFVAITTGLLLVATSIGGSAQVGSPGGTTACAAGSAQLEQTDKVQDQTADVENDESDEDMTESGDESTLSDKDKADQDKADNEKGDKKKADQEKANASDEHGCSNDSHEGSQSNKGNNRD